METTSPRSAVLLSSTPRPPPTEVLLFPFGTIQTTKGALKFTRRSAQLVAAQWTRLGRDIGFDYEHDAFSKTLAGKDRVAAAWGRLELRQDGLWVVGIRWTPDAAAKVSSLAFRYLSPALAHDKGEITGVANVALTNFPATLDAQPLLLSSHLPDTMDETNQKKHGALAQGMLQGCSALLSAAQAAAESDDPGLKETGGKIAAMLPEMMAALKQAHPDASELCSDKPLADQVRLLTGLDGDAALAELMALHNRSKVVTTTVERDAAAKHKDILDGLVKAGQIHLSDRRLYEPLTLSALQEFQKRAPKVHGPRSVPGDGSLELSGQPDGGAAGTGAPEADALLSMVKVG